MRKRSDEQVTTIVCQTVSLLARDMFERGVLSLGGRTHRYIERYYTCGAANISVERVPRDVWRLLSFVEITPTPKRAQLVLHGRATAC